MASLLIFGFDLLITLNTAFYDQGVVVWDKRKIFHQYMSTSFVYDLIGSIPLILGIYYYKLTYSFQELANVHSTFKIWNILIFIKVVTLNQVIEDFKDLFFKNRRVFNTLQLIQLLFYAIFVAHCFGCLFQLLAVIENIYQVENNWINKYELNNNDWVERYIYVRLKIIIVIFQIKIWKYPFSWVF